MIKAKPKSAERPNIDPVKALARARQAIQSKEDAALMGELGKPFLIQLNADMEKAVEEIRILWGMKSRAQAIRVLIGKGITLI